MLSLTQPHAVPSAAEWLVPGWYVACASTALRHGRPQAVTLAGEKLVVYRGRSGKVVAHQARCPHLGASLAHGKVIGDSIQCPFHFWRYDASGACVEIPACRKIPPAARVRTYPVHELLGAVWVYLGDGAPYFTLPTDEALLGPKRFMSGVVDFGELTVNARDVVENMIDISHARLHFMEGDAWEFDFHGDDGPCITGYYQIRGTAFGLSFLPYRAKQVNRLYGPGLWVILGMMGKLRMMLATMVAPVTRDRTRVLMSVSIGAPGWMPWIWALGHYLKRGMTYGLKQDVTVWNHKHVLERPVLSAADGPIVRFRKWYAGLSEVAKAPDPARRDEAMRLPLDFRRFEQGALAHSRADGEHAHAD